MELDSKAFVENFVALMEEARRNFEIDKITARLYDWKSAWKLQKSDYLDLS